MAVESRGRRSGSERDSATRARLDAFEKEKKRRKLAQLTEEQKRRRLGESRDPTHGENEGTSRTLNMVDTGSPAGTFEQIRDGRRERINALGTEMERAQADLRQLDEQSIGATRRLAEIQRLPDTESAKPLAAEIEAELTRINEQRKIARKKWEDTFTARDTETRALLSLLDQRVKDIQEGKAVLQPRPLDPSGQNMLPGPGSPERGAPGNESVSGITASQLIRAADGRISIVDQAVANKMGVAPDKLMGWWRRKAHVVANAVLGSLTGMTVGAAVAKTGLGGWAVGALGLGAGTMSALAVPIVITAGLAIPAVHYLRKALGQQEMDRRAQAGRVADKLQKKITKAERSAGNEWFSAGPFNQARLEAEAERLAKKPAWGAIAGSLATGMLTGAISYDIHTGGRLTAAAWENVPTRAQAGGWFSGAWQGITSLFSGALSSQPADPLGLAPSLTQCASAFEVRTIVQETMREGLRPLIAAVSDLGDAIDTLSSTTAGIQDRLQDLTRDIGILERSVQLLGGDMQRFSGQMGDLQRQIADLSQSVRGLRVPGIANDALTALTTRVDALEAAVLQGAQSAPPLRPPLAPPLWAPLPETLLSPDIFSQTSGSRGTWGMLENIFHTAGVDPADIGRQFNLNQSDSRFVMSLLIDAHDGIFEPGRAAYDPNIAREILGVDSARRIGPSGREVDWTAFFDRTDVRDSIEQRIEAGLKRRFNENLGGRIFSYLSDRLDLIYKSAAQ